MTVLCHMLPIKFVGVINCLDILNCSNYVLASTGVQKKIDFLGKRKD